LSYIISFLYLTFNFFSIKKYFSLFLHPLYYLDYELQWDLEKGLKETIPYYKDAFTKMSND